MAPASGPPVLRRRLGGGPVAPLKIASGCDRRCTFCAIPAFRGAFVSRRPPELLAEAAGWPSQGVRELVLVSENSTSYGKDLGDLRLLETLLPALAAVPGIERVRVSYLQPAELRPGLIEVDRRHARRGPVLRPVLPARQRPGAAAGCGGSATASGSSELLDRIRELAPEAGVRSNFIVGFPGETEDDLEELELFLTEARLDAIGVFGYSDEDGTEAASLPGKLDEAEVARRVDEVAELAEELMSQRGRRPHRRDCRRADRGGGRRRRVRGPVPRTRRPRSTGPPRSGPRRELVPGQIVRATVTGSEGVDLTATADTAPAAPAAPAQDPVRLSTARSLADRR